MVFVKRKDSGKKNGEKPRRLKERVVELLELPKEIVLNMPRITMLGNRNLMIENYKGIIEYDSGKIRLNTAIGALQINGSNLLIREITAEDVVIDGDILSIEIQK